MILFCSFKENEATRAIEAMHQDLVRKTEALQQKMCETKASQKEVLETEALRQKLRETEALQQQQVRETESLQQQLHRHRKQHKELISRFDVLNAQLAKKKINTFEQLAEQDKEGKNTLIQLAQQTKPSALEGYNIGLFGITSTGKSTMLNSLLDREAAETGPGETTTEVKSYPGRGYTLWDVPGRNDEMSYLSMEYISFFKGLSKRLILIQSTVKENSSLMKLLDQIGIKYDIVFNKFDQINEGEREKLKKQIHSEVQSIGLRNVSRIYFVSSKHPQMFDDWVTMAHNLTG